MRRLLPIGIALATASASLLVAASTSTTGATSSAPAAADQNRTQTQFAFRASGYGTRVSGGQLPASSDGTAYQAIGCTNLAGLDRRNFEARVTVPGFGVLHGVRTRVWTKKEGNKFSSNSKHTIARLNIGKGSALGSLKITGLESFSSAFNQNGKFKAATRSSVASIVYTDPAGQEQVLDIPTPGEPIVIPGLARISAGRSVENVKSDFARAGADVLDIKVIPTDTRSRVAHSSAQISGGVKRGIFKGFAAALRARGLANNARVGRTPLILMPCQGTKGKVQLRDIARVDLGDPAVLKALATGQIGTNTNAKASGIERGQVLDATLGEGRVTVSGIVGQVTVTRTESGLKRTAKGTTVGRILLDGEELDFPDSDVIEIPGLLRLEQRIIKKVKNGLSVVALRVTVLDGTGAVIDLGIAKLQIRKGPVS